jgi:type IX secretion system PorP/SprF family membrane protein
MKRFIKILVLIVLLPAIGYAQDIQFTQFYATPLYLNPAFAGANVCSRVALTHRNQWPGINNVYRSYLASFDHGFVNSHVGIGVTAGMDEAGDGSLRTTIINPAISYEAIINRASSIRFGVQPGFGLKSINMNRLVFGDQIYRGGDVPTIENIPQSVAFFDFATGAIYSHGNYWAGLSVFHLNVPNESMYNSLFGALPVKYSFHAGARFDLDKMAIEMREKRFLTPVLHYRGQREYDQFDIGFYYSKGRFTLGGWYRGIPGLKAYKPGYQNNDAVAFIIGVEAPKFKCGYSYDKTISDLAAVSRGAHEITMSFQLCTVKTKKRKMKLISCPKF